MRHRRKLSFITCMHSFTQITSRIELRGIVPSNQIKVTFIIILFYPSAWFVFDFFLFHIEIEGNCGWIIGGGGGGGGGGGVGPLSNYWVGLNPPPPTFLRLWSTWTTKQWTPNIGRHPTPLFLRLWSTWTTKQLTPNIGRYRKSICSRKF